MTSAIFLIYALGHCGLFIAALIRFFDRRSPATVPLLLVTAGLVYDNGMLAVGQAVGLGQQLEQLSVPRFFLHAISTPLLILTALGFVQRTGVNWSARTTIKALAVALVLSLVVFGFWSDMIMLSLEAQQDGGLVSFGNANSIPVAPIATIVALIGAGIVIWCRGGGAMLLAAAIVQFGAAALADAVVVAGNFGEVALLAGLVWTDWKLSPPRSHLRT